MFCALSAHALECSSPALLCPSSRTNNDGGRGHQAERQWTRANESASCAPQQVRVAGESKRRAGCMRFRNQRDARVRVLQNLPTFYFRFKVNYEPSEFLCPKLVATVSIQA